MTPTWRLANSIATLQTMVNQQWPNRSKVSDGTIGDARHANEGQASDHNPWIAVNGVGVVRAFDITCDGIPHNVVAEWLRTLGASGDHRLANGGYVIHERQIASNINNWQWRAYGGADPHTSHIHVSVSRTEAWFDSTAPWVWRGAVQPPMQPRKRDNMPKPIIVQDDAGAVWTLTPGSLHTGRAHVNDPVRLQEILDDDIGLQGLTGDTWLASRNVFRWSNAKVAGYQDVAKVFTQQVVPISEADISRIVGAIGAALVKG